MPWMLLTELVSSKLLKYTKTNFEIMIFIGKIIGATEVNSNESLDVFETIDGYTFRVCIYSSIIAHTLASDVFDVVFDLMRQWQSFKFSVMDRLCLPSETGLSTWNRRCLLDSSFITASMEV